MFFRIRAKEKGDSIHLSFITKADRLLLESIYSTKVRLFFLEKKKSFLLLPYYVIPRALAFEIAYLFLGAYRITNKARYARAFTEVVQSTWLQKALHPDPVTIDDTALTKALTIKLLPYQKEFLEHYMQSKQSRHLRGYFLAFEQGLGKTLTAIGLSQLLEVEQVLIVCPASIRTVWARELKKVVKKYKNSTAVWEQEIFVTGIHQPVATKDKKFIIANFQSLHKALPMIDKSKKKLLVIDESHLIKELKSARTQAIIKLMQYFNFEDIVLQSGTPIKGESYELLPILLILDNLVDARALAFYNKLMRSDNANLMKVFNAKFQYLSFRKTKLDVEHVLHLPPKHQHTLNIKLSTAANYQLTTVKKVVAADILNTLKKEKPFLADYQKLVDALTQKYKHKTSRLTQNYKAYMHVVLRMRAGDILTEEDRKVRNDYEKELLSVMSKANKKVFRQYVGRANNLYASAIGQAIGNIYMGLYRQMVVDIAKESTAMLQGVYGSSKSGKVIVLASYPEAVETCAKGLEAAGFNVVTITGATDQRQRVLNLERFAEDDSLEFLVGTLEILSVGFTLVEADSLVFLNQPWRWVDKNQAEDRIHRIGQVNPVHIYTILLEHAEKTLSSRNNFIVKRSKDIFEKIIGGPGLSPSKNKQAEV